MVPHLSRESLEETAMRIHVDVRIETTPEDSQLGGIGYGNLAFSESAHFDNAGFETVSKIFTRCHELLETVKAEHGQTQRGRRP